MYNSHQWDHSQMATIGRDEWTYAERREPLSVLPCVCFMVQTQAEIKDKHVNLANMLIDGNERNRRNNHFE